MSIYCKTYTIKSRIAASMLMAFIIICAVTTEVGAKKPIFDARKKTIVLDPGHGGQDKGAQGPDGTFEKRVTLTLARLIATELENKYNVVLTRTDDYRLDIPSRTAAANHLKADLFISLHTGGSFLHKASGMSIFYFKETSTQALTLENAPSKPLKSSETNTAWDSIQNNHAITSKALAQLMQKRINEKKKNIKTRIQGAPITVLEGADMPAILIEIGCLTNPAEEKALRDTKVLSDFAKRIGKGIEDFFSHHQQ